MEWEFKVSIAIIIGCSKVHTCCLQIGRRSCFLGTSILRHHCRRRLDYRNFLGGWTYQCLGSHITCGMEEGLHELLLSSFLRLWNFQRDLIQIPVLRFQSKEEGFKGPHPTIGHHLHTIVKLGALFSKMMVAHWQLRIP